MDLLSNSSVYLCLHHVCDRMSKLYEGTITRTWDSSLWNRLYWNTRVLNVQGVIATSIHSVRLVSGYYNAIDVNHLKLMKLIQDNNNLKADCRLT